MVRAHSCGTPRTSRCYAGGRNSCDPTRGQGKSVFGWYMISFVQMSAQTARLTCLLAQHRDSVWVCNGLPWLPAAVEPRDHALRSAFFPSLRIGGRGGGGVCRYPD